MVWNSFITDILKFGPFCLKPSKKIILQANLKETLGNGFTVKVQAGYVKLMLKTLDF